MEANMKVSAIMTSKGTKALAEDFQKKVLARLSMEGTAESLDLLYTLRDELKQEASAGLSSSEEIGRLVSGLGAIRFSDEILGYAERFDRLLAEQFAARASVNRIHELSCAFNEKLVSTALIHSMDLLHQEGRFPPDVPTALMVSGEMGRREVILGERSSFFFIFQDSDPEEREYLDDLAIRLMAVLSVRFPSVSRSLFKGGNLFWSGSRSEWESFVSAPLRGADPGSSMSGSESDELLFSRMLETAADLRWICGDRELSESLLTHTGKLLAEVVSGDRFWHLAKTVAVMPLALSIFGRIKTERSGKHRGEFSLKELAIDPLVACARMLAVAQGVTGTATIARLKAVLAAGNLGVTLADRLLVAYQDFMRQFVRIELGTGSLDGNLFLNPDDLDEASRERLISGLEDISTLQRFVYQQLVEVEQ